MSGINKVLDAFEEGWRLGQYNDCVDFGEGDEFEEIWKDSNTFQDVQDILAEEEEATAKVKARKSIQEIISMLEDEEDNG